ncbi:unnamed protein product [Vitrella brassicaformis CCMP3155]|uniref:Uncharacterized protein n=1 Tax=Vitrella brassicaformis (strain CCMP3155) TaxID=1169540 RepID=A0A0G4GTW0_VITBC|nr:unnamed protein product [Vitrella brassicaformis CCMP3155]|eukprot:CEM34189.1 unnamed protein product [Vitrella brassicaformis CCMP3155]
MGARQSRGSEEDNEWWECAEEEAENVTSGGIHVRQRTCLHQPVPATPQGPPVFLFFPLSGGRPTAVDGQRGEQHHQLQQQQEQAAPPSRPPRVRIVEGKAPVPQPPHHLGRRQVWRPVNRQPSAAAALTGRPASQAIAPPPPPPPPPQTTTRVWRPKCPPTAPEAPTRLSPQLRATGAPTQIWTPVAPSRRGGRNPPAGGRRPYQQVEGGNTTTTTTNTGAPEGRPRTIPQVLQPTPRARRCHWRSRSPLWNLHPLPLLLRSVLMKVLMDAAVALVGDDDDSPNVVAFLAPPCQARPPPPPPPAPQTPLSARQSTADYRHLAASSSRRDSRSSRQPFPPMLPPPPPPRPSPPQAPAHPLIFRPGRTVSTASSAVGAWEGEQVLDQMCWQMEQRERETKEREEALIRQLQEAQWRSAC